MNNLTPSKEEINQFFTGHWGDFFSRFIEIKRSVGKHSRSLCPFHEEKEPSFSVNTENGLFKCFGCGKAGDAFSFYGKLKGISSFPEVLQGIGRECGISSNGGSSTKGKSEIIKTYDYTNEAGFLLFQVCRYAGKSFRQRKPDGAGGWTWKLAGVRRVLYHLPEILKADFVLIPEGEKDCDNLREWGFTATTNPGGAGNWKPEFSECLRGKYVVLLPDNDEAGRRHIQVVGSSLQGVAKSIQILELPDLPEKGDVSDWIQAGGKKATLDELIVMAPEWKDREPKNNSQYNDLNERNETIELENRLWQKWPVLGGEALRGIAGRFVDLACSHSEADPSAVLATFLCRFSVEAGSKVFLYVGDSRQFARVFFVLVGASSKSRKGTSARPVERAFKMDLLAVDEGWKPARISPGPLSTGEGLVFAVRDEVTTWKVDKKTGLGEETVTDPGVTDKRLFVLDEEFSSALISSRRDGNTLSTILRCIWDSGDIEPLTKNNRIKATGAHIGIVSHITLAELNRRLEETEAFSGFANRILWVCARRQGIVPFPEPMPDKELASFQWELKRIIEKAKGFGQILLHQETKEMWAELYPDLSTDHSGLVGAVLDRAEAQTVRLAMIYALLDSSEVVRPDHLRSALAVWRYCEDSAKFIFAGREVNPFSNKILELLREEGKTTTQIYDAFSRNISKRQLETALEELIAQKKVQVEMVREEGQRGRPKTIFRGINS